MRLLTFHLKKNQIENFDERSNDYWVLNRFMTLKVLET